MDTYPGQTDPTAVAGRRFGAFVIDWIVLAAIPLAIFFATANLTFYRSPSTCAQVIATGEKSSSENCRNVDNVTINSDEYSAMTYKPAAFFLAGGVYLLYLILVEWVVQAMTGATLGKAIFGIRTVDEQGQPPGLGKQFLRGLVWIVDSLCNALVAAILILTTKGHRRLGDMAAKTFVVRKDAKGSPIMVPGMAPAAVAAGAGGYGAGTYAATPPGPGYSAPPAPGTGGATPPTTPDPTVVATPPVSDDQTVVSPDPTPTAPPTAPATDGPQWDAARGAYIQWDPAGNRWLTYDDAASQWKPIEDQQPPPPPT
jgi:uncharacterized RDD family membrane protein YckC